MADIKSINGNPIVPNAVEANTITDAMLVQSGVMARLAYANDGEQTFRRFGNFQNYGLNPDGSFLTSQRYRVSNDDDMTFDHDVTICVVDDGFKYGYVTGTTWCGWFTYPITIPAGLPVHMQIARVSERTGEVADVAEFTNAIRFYDVASEVKSFLGMQSPKTFVGSELHNGTWENGKLTAWNARLSSPVLWPVKSGNRFECSLGSGLDIMLYVLDKDTKADIYNSGWVTPTEAFTTTIDVDGLFSFNIRKTAGGSISQSDFTGDCTLYYGAVDAYGSRLDAIDEQIDTGLKPYSYFGEKMPAKANGFGAERLLTMSYSGSGMTSQDIECFGDYLFVAFSGDQQIRVYSLSTKQLLAYMPVDTQHGTGMQFSSEYYADGDEFPLLYVGGWTGNIANVVRIVNSNGAWTASVVRSLTIPETYGYYMAPSIDAEHNVLYAYGYSRSSNQSTNNSMKLVKADLNQLTDNGNGTYTPKILSEIEAPYAGVTQGRKFFGGSLYVGFAATSTPHNARLVTIDATTGDVKADIPMSAVTTSENEGVCYRVNGNEIEWYYSDYYNVFKLGF